jgi:hypothetical protein
MTVCCLQGHRSFCRKPSPDAVDLTAMSLQMGLVYFEHLQGRQWTGGRLAEHHLLLVFRCHRLQQGGNSPEFNFSGPSTVIRRQRNTHTEDISILFRPECCRSMGSILDQFACTGMDDIGELLGLFSS